MTQFVHKVTSEDAGMEVREITRKYFDFSARLRNRIKRQKLTIVLAHIERYYRFQKDMDIWDCIMDLPLHTQINAGSFVNKGRFLRPDRRWQFCIDFLQDHPDTLHMGSDCHNMVNRPPNLEKGREGIKAKLGQEALDRIDASTAKLLGL